MSPIPPRPALSGAVLAGGRGERMGGRDKGLVDWRGEPLIAHVSARLRPQVGELIVIANRNADRYRAYADAVHPDLEPGFHGPLMGIATALAHARHDWVLCVSCDSPMLPFDLADRLWQAASQAGADACAARVGEEIHPVVCLLRRTLAESARQTLAVERRSVKEWLGKQRFVWADFSDCPAEFVNLNRTDELNVPSS